MSDDTVECAEHGPQAKTYVCQHLVQSLCDGKPRGFFCSESDVPRPEAWCAECEALLAATGGHWNDETGKQAGVRLLCGVCYDRAKAINQGQVCERRTTLGISE